MLVLDMLFVVSAVLFDMLKARQLACVSKSGQKCPAALSLSSWRAWIEIRRPIRSDAIPRSRSPHGERGLKYVGYDVPHWVRPRRSPHGERGLKSAIRTSSTLARPSLSSWRAWIEMQDCWHNAQPDHASLSSWRAWIEIGRQPVVPHRKTPVALLMESVD